MGNPKSGIHLQYVDFKRIFPFSCRRSKRAAPAGDAHREIGDPNRTQLMGRRFLDQDTGNLIYVRGNRVLVTDKSGNPVTQFKNPRANTQLRIRTGRWIPLD